MPLSVTNNDVPMSAKTAIHMVPNVKVEAGALLISLNDELEKIAVRTATIQLQQAQDTLTRYTGVRFKFVDKLHGIDSTVF